MTYPIATVRVGPRGCGERRDPLGFYAESGLLRSGGLPLRFFLCDPVDKLPPGLDARNLANKPKVWVDPSTDTAHLISWVGIGSRGKGYPYVWDKIQEIAEMGESRGIDADLPDLERLVPGKSRLILVHPRCYNPLWREQRPPRLCEKGIEGYDLAQLGESREGWHGPCLYQVRDLIPRRAASEVKQEGDGERPTICLRRWGSIEYEYEATGQDDSQLGPAIFAVLPLTGFCLVMDASRRVNERAKARLERMAFPFYESDELLPRDCDPLESSRPD